MKLNYWNRKSYQVRETKTGLMIVEMHNHIHVMTREQYEKAKPKKGLFNLIKAFLSI